MSRAPRPARLLWDGGYFWSLMCLEAAEALGLDLVPITADQVARGRLEQARLLVVPGGRPALKKRALGPDGAAALRRWLSAGGCYLGFCGGAGLALQVSDGLGLVELGRAAGRLRLPSLSGPMQVVPAAGQEGHPMWPGLDRPASLHVWWPGQFAWNGDPDDGSLRAVALYHGAAPGLYTADLAVDQVSPGGWSDLESDYGLNLDPAALAGQPAVVEARLGAGKLLLSYLHLDTPHQAAASQALSNLWQQWAGLEPGERPARAPRAEQPHCRLSHGARELWRLGLSLGLWRERGGALPIWRRGARGLEVWSLVAMTLAACHRLEDRPPDDLLARRVEASLSPLWDQGRRVLEAQAARLAGRPVPAAAAARERSWFPAPRRIGGGLLQAMDVLSEALFRLAVAEPA